MGQTLMQRLIVGVMRTNCYLVYKDNTKETLVVDPADKVEKISQALE